MGVDCAVSTSVEASESSEGVEEAALGLLAWQTTQAAKISRMMCMKMMVRKGAALGGKGWWLMWVDVGLGQTEGLMEEMLLGTIELWLKHVQTCEHMATSETRCGYPQMLAKLNKGRQITKTNNGDYIEYISYLSLICAHLVSQFE